ncbi:MAG TPA: hypothetical protein VIL23_05470 [Clostridia bacterium]
MNDRDDTFYDINTIASMSECTGLIPSAIESEEEAEHYGELYSIHKNKERDTFNRKNKK